MINEYRNGRRYLYKDLAYIIKVVLIILEKLFSIKYPDGVRKRKVNSSNQKIGRKPKITLRGNKRFCNIIRRVFPVKKYHNFFFLFLIKKVSQC